MAHSFVKLSTSPIPLEEKEHESKATEDADQDNQDISITTHRLPPLTNRLTSNKDISASIGPAVK